MHHCLPSQASATVFSCTDTFCPPLRRPRICTWTIDSSTSLLVLNLVVMCQQGRAMHDSPCYHFHPRLQHCDEPIRLPVHRGRRPNAVSHRPNATYLPYFCLSTVVGHETSFTQPPFITLLGLSTHWSTPKIRLEFSPRFANSPRKNRTPPH